jgi:hypothetical protein
METVRQFNRTQPIKIKILSGTLKECQVRYPSDEEWANRTRRQKIVRTQVTGGKFVTDVINVESTDAQLLKAIRLDPDSGVVFTDAEASKIINKLDASEMGEVTHNGDRFSIELRTKFGNTRHTLKTPMEDAARKFSRASSRPVSGRRLEETVVSLEPSGEFYDAVFVSSEGYVGEGTAAIPLNHKDVVVVELLHQVRQIEDELDPED